MSSDSCASPTQLLRQQRGRCRTVPELLILSAILMVPGTTAPSSGYGADGSFNVRNPVREFDLARVMRLSECPLLKPSSALLGLPKSYQ